MITDIVFDNDDFASFVMELSAAFSSPVDILFGTSEIMEIPFKIRKAKAIWWN